MLTKKAADALSASMSSLFEVEITTTLGCPVRCSYCPQDQLLETRGDRKRILSYENFIQGDENNVILCGQLNDTILEDIPTENLIDNLEISPLEELI